MRVVIMYVRYSRGVSSMYLFVKLLILGTFFGFSSSISSWISFYLFFFIFLLFCLIFVCICFQCFPSNLSSSESVFMLNWCYNISAKCSVSYFSVCTVPLTPWIVFLSAWFFVCIRVFIWCGRVLLVIFSVITVVLL